MTDIVECLQIAQAIRRWRYESKGVLEFCDETAPFEEDEMEEALAILDALSADGKAVVPVELTKAMRKAAILHVPYGDRPLYVELWEVMIAAYKQEAGDD